MSSLKASDRSWRGKGTRGRRACEGEKARTGLKNGAATASYGIRVCACLWPVTHLVFVLAGSRADKKAVNVVVVIAPGRRSGQRARLMWLRRPESDEGGSSVEENGFKVFSSKHG